MENPSEKGKQRMKTGTNDKLYESKCKNLGTYMYFCTKSVNPTIGFQ